MSLTKEEHIKYWVETAKKDLRTVDNMYSARDYLPALFFAHLHIEKLCKAHWVKNNKEHTPPKTHNLIKLLNEAGIEYSKEQMDFMIVLNGFQIEGRYPDYLDSLYKTYKSKKTSEIIKKVKKLSTWLQQQL